MTAACMLIKRESFARVGGFDTAYRYGTEDVDLGLQAPARRRAERRGGPLGADPQRVLQSEPREPRLPPPEPRGEPAGVPRESWGPQVLREYRLARLRCEPFWTGGAGAHVAVTLTSLDVADGWGDWYSGHEIGDALEDLGWRVSYVERKGDRWYELPEDLDYVLSLMDSFDLSLVPDHVGTIAWIRNWTERWLERPWFDHADVLLASSQGSAELIEERTGRRTAPLPAGGQPGALSPPAGRGAVRRRLRVHRQPLGQGSRHPACARAARGRAGGDLRKGLGGGCGRARRTLAESCPTRISQLLYPSVKLVLDDTQGPTLPYGAVNARVFDALASGTLVITNCESGVRELFDEDFPVWSSRESLRASLDELLADERRRSSLAARYRQVVLSRHTYAHRAARLREILIEHEQRLTFCLKIGAPNREVAPRWGDLHFAESIARSCAGADTARSIQTLDEWEDEAGLRYDVVVHLKGRPLSPQAGPVQRAVVDQPSRRADRRGVRRL